MANDAYFMYILGLCGMPLKATDPTDWPELPSENPSSMELREWLRIWQGGLDQGEWGAIVNGADPMT